MTARVPSGLGSTAAGRTLNLIAAYGCGIMYANRGQPNAFMDASLEEPLVNMPRQGNSQTDGLGE